MRSWLRTRDDTASLATVRASLFTEGVLQLAPLYDRRAIINSLYHRSTLPRLIGVFGPVGAATALLLALVG